MRNVVAHRVTQNIVERLSLGNIGTLLSDNGYQLALVIETLAFLGEGMDWD